MALASGKQQELDVEQFLLDIEQIEPHFEKRFGTHSYACRVGKGTHRVLARAAAFA